MDTTSSDTADQLNRFLDGASKYLRDKRQRAAFATYALGLLTEGEHALHAGVRARFAGESDESAAGSRGSAGGSRG